MQIAALVAECKCSGPCCPLSMWMGGGGKRKGAGSKPKPIDQTKPIQKGFRCSMEVGAFLAEVGTGFIEDVIRVSEVFKRWSKGK